MAPPKKEQGKIKLQVKAGQANPSPPIGPALGQRGLNLMDFCKAFNERSSKDYAPGTPLTVVITYYADRTFTFIIRTPPMSYFIKQAIGITAGSKTPGKGPAVAKITKEQCMKIAEAKIKDSNAYHLDQVVSMVMGSARSMGIEVLQ